MNAVDEYNALIDGAIERLEALADAGVTYLPKLKVATEAVEACAPAAFSAEDVSPSDEAAPIKTSLIDPVVSPDSLNSLDSMDTVCAVCPAVNAAAPVVGAGSGKTGLFIVRGMPVEPDSEADTVMTVMIEAMKFTRPGVWLTHAVRCRIDAALVTPEVISACRARLDEEIERLRPRVIVALGPLAALALLNAPGLAEVRGGFCEYKGIKVMASYDPADIVGNTGLRQQTWADMQAVMAELKKACKG